MENRFEGDGRHMLYPSPDYNMEGTQPLRMRRSTARMIIESFQQNGETVHSRMGGTLWVVLEWCAATCTPRTITRYEEDGRCVGWSIAKSGTVYKGTAYEMLNPRSRIAASRPNPREG